MLIHPAVPEVFNLARLSFVAMCLYLKNSIVVLAWQVDTNRNGEWIYDLANLFISWTVQAQQLYIAV